MEVLPIIALVVALVATVLAFVFIVPEKKRPQLKKFGRFLHDTFNFKYLIVEKILQAVYIFTTIYVVLLGFCMLFYVQPGYDGYYYNRPSQWMGGYGLLIMIVGPILIRLSYEFIMMGILLVRNVIQINNKLSENGSSVANKSFNLKTPVAPAPVPVAPAPAPVAPAPAPVEPTPVAPVEPTPVAPAQPVAEAEFVFCTNCGSKVEAGKFCPYCGSKVQ